ncbi:MAG: hypothetical protein V3T81_06295 [Thermoanaerobaculia bacterium]
MQTHTEKLRFALDKYPEKVELAPIEDLLLDTARRNDKRPAYVKLAVPDELVKGLRGRRQEHDTVLLVRIPSDVLKRAESLIVLPGEVR